MSVIIASTYEVIQQIGSGGGGRVYLANHMRLGKKVVLKADKRKLTTRPELLRREVDILKTLQHPYIPQVYDFFVEDDTVYTVMDYIEGESLDRPLKRGDKMLQAQIVCWAQQLLEALEYLHSPIHGDPPRGFVHSDIKPANLMLRPNGDICLIDFNIALAIGEQNAVGGSAGYASPEHYGLDYSFGSSSDTVPVDETSVMTADDKGCFLFDQTAKEQKYDVLNDPQNRYAALADGSVVLASLNSPVVRIVSFENHSDATLFRYDPAYAHDEARINLDGTAAMLFSYKGFQLIDRDGNIIKEIELPNAAQVYDQQYRKDKDGARLEVTYYDGLIAAYSGDTGELLWQRNGDKPDESLGETFYTDRYRIESPLHGTPVAYNRETGEKVCDLERDAYLTYVTQIGDNVLTEYISDKGERWGLLLDGNLQTIAKLPDLCDTSNGTLIFDYRTGNLRQSRIYSIDQLKNLAKKELEEKQS